MKKSIITASLLALGITSASAMDLDIFVGLEGNMVDTSSSFSATTGTIEYWKAGNTTPTNTFSPLTGAADERSMGYGIGLKAGVVLNENHRISVIATDYSNLEVLGADMDMQTYTLNYDYMFVNDSKATPYLGLNAGMSDVEILGYSDMSEMYGVQGGVIVEITDHIEWEMGASYSILTSNPTTGVQTKTYNHNEIQSLVFNGAEAEVELQDMVKTYIGLNYKF